jgi:hypothetical protein
VAFAESVSRPQLRLGADKGKNHLNSASQQRGGHAGNAAYFIDSIGQKRTSLYGAIKRDPAEFRQAGMRVNWISSPAPRYR